jgi:hypothetical protein
MPTHRKTQAASLLFAQRQRCGKAFPSAVTSIAPRKRPASRSAPERLRKLATFTRLVRAGKDGPEGQREFSTLR